ncbi:MAG: DUF2155 domain-containing protein [Xanthobacteraceae bacterium]|jgi:hypothetical protein
MVRLISSAWLWLLIGAVPAAAQFGNIFDPPRPPSDVPGRPPARPAPQYQPPPPQAAPAPAADPAYGSPRPGAVQSQPLPPPQGAEQANQQALPRPPLPPGGPPDQRLPRGAAPAANAAPQPGDEVVTELPSQKIGNSTAVFSGLDKITGRIIKFDVAINETVQFGALQVTPRVCYTRPPTETPNTDAFVEVQEITLQGEVRRIFGGWMFVASPGLHGVEHPIYDVWLTDCKGAVGPTVAAAPEPKPAANPVAPAAPARPPQGSPPRR